MKKYMNCFIGTIINIVTGLAGAVIWALMSDSVRMKSDNKSLVMVLLVVAFIPSAILYFIWFVNNRKRLETPGEVMRKFAPSFCIGLVITAAVLLIPGVFLFPKALTYMIIALAISMVGNLFSYLVLKVKNH